MRSTYGISPTARRRRSPASLYRDGVEVLRGNVPVAFPAPGDVIEVATSLYRVKHMHYVGHDRREQALRPYPRSPEGLQARFPCASAVIGAVGLVVLLVGLTATLTVAVEQITRIEVVAQHFGTFVSPIQLPGWTKQAQQTERVGHAEVASQSSMDGHHAVLNRSSVITTAFARRSMRTLCHLHG